MKNRRNEERVEKRCFEHLKPFNPCSLLSTILLFTGVISTIGKFPKIHQLRMILSVSIFFLEGNIMLTTLPFLKMRISSVKMEKGERFIKKEIMKNGKVIYFRCQEPLNFAVYNTQLSWPNDNTQPS